MTQWPPLVLIVDDNERNPKLARDVLEPPACATLVAATAAEALALAREHLPGRHPDGSSPSRYRRPRGGARSREDRADGSHSRRRAQRHPAPRTQRLAPRRGLRAATSRSRSTSGRYPSRCAAYCRAGLSHRAIGRLAPWTPLGTSVSRSLHLEGRRDKEPKMKASTLSQVRTLLAAGSSRRSSSRSRRSAARRPRRSEVATLQTEADLYQIDQIEVKFHRATSTTT